MEHKGGVLVHSRRAMCDLESIVANRDIVVIGGSAGATAPLRNILSRLPADLPAAVFIVLHVPSHGIGILSTVTSAASKLQVRQAEHGLAIENGNIYLAAPDHHLLLHDGHIFLGRGPRENMVRPAIDPLFRSAAMHYGPRVIGMVLSGLLSDGAAGLNAIKSCGGIALVQDPSDATADEMPLRALETTEVDLCVPSAKLGDVLSDLVREAPDSALPPPKELALEVAIAAGERIDSQRLMSIASPAALTCPACGGVLSVVDGKPLRFRCQVGHAYTADALAKEQESRVDEALRVALRIIEERAELVHRMAEDGRQSGRRAVAEMYDSRAEEYRHYAEVIREAVLRSLDPPLSGDSGDD
jgi:two-component system, chemotaxis family, protein-glutamate methylesterase/glutaminase